MINGPDIVVGLVCGRRFFRFSESRGSFTFYIPEEGGRVERAAAEFREERTVSEWPKKRS